MDSFTGNSVHHSQQVDPEMMGDTESIFDDHKETEEDYYKSIMFEFSVKSYKDAIDDINNLRRKFPFSKYNEKLYQMQVFLYYLRKDYDKIEEMADQFYIKYPKSKNLPYMIYMKSLALKFMIKDTSRQKGIMEDGLKFSKYIAEEYKNTPYKKAAEKNIEYFLNLIIENEIKIGDFYFNEKDYISAFSRYLNFIKEYGEYNKDKKNYAKKQLEKLEKLLSSDSFK